MHGATIHRAAAGARPSFFAWSGPGFLALLRGEVYLFRVRVLVITGAGISAESGIPTFRGRDGYWRNLDPMKLATPEAFARDPNLVWEWYWERREKIRAARPNPGHAAISTLAQEADHFLLVTQNVDDLHARAGLEREKMVQIHGDIFETRCSRCDFTLQEREQAKGKEGVPACAKCGAPMRPGVVWFGEMLDPRKIDAVEDFLDGGVCDITLVIGTTALFGYITGWAVRGASAGGKLIEVNLEPTPLSGYASRVVRAPAAHALPRLVAELSSGSRKRSE
jgi:NAD-dependent deacetylase